MVKQEEEEGDSGVPVVPAKQVKNLFRYLLPSNESIFLQKLSNLHMNNIRILPNLSDTLLNRWGWMFTTKYFVLTVATLYSTSFGRPIKSICNVNSTHIFWNFYFQFIFIWALAWAQMFGISTSLMFLKRYIDIFTARACKKYLQCQLNLSSRHSWKISALMKHLLKYLFQTRGRTRC